MASTSAGSTPSGPGEVAGSPKSFLTTALETAASAIERFYPIKQIGAHLVALHSYAHDPKRQVEAHHYCSHLNQDFHQCVIYDSDRADARLIGVEFIVSDKVFKTLPEEEKKMWHSHEYEVCGGLLNMPGVPSTAEKSMMQHLAKTYGKTWHFWEFDRGDKLPLGVPRLMASVTNEKEFDSTLVAELEKKYGFKREQKEKQRSNISGPEGGVDPAADQCNKGKGLRLVLEEFGI